MRSLTPHRSAPPPARFRRRTSHSLDAAASIPFYSSSSPSPKDSFFMSPMDDWADHDVLPVEYVLSSSDGDDSDGDFLLSPLTDMDLPHTAKVSTNDALTVTAHRLGLIGKGHKRHRINYGIWNNFGLITFLTVLILFVDWYAWKIVRIPLPTFHLSRPFFLSAALVACAGYVCVPLLDVLMVHDTVRRIGYFMFSRKRPTPTMGGLFMVPIGVGVAVFLAGFTCVEVSAAALATVVFAAIGFVDDVVRIIKKHHAGLSMWTKCLLEVASGFAFAVWLDTANIASPYSMKMLVPLPAPMGLVFLGKFYLLVTSLCFVSMGRGIDLTDGPDGLAAGIAALAFIGMSVAVLPICSELGIFGASMAGACVGFLLHNRYKASVLLGNTGSLALGGALAAMAACTGMFFPLFISSGIIVLEAFSVLMQVG
ncbi:Phospho-N-acetylmuramoyl-pentapeptide-transferasehomolog [Linum grandiflorum]